MLISAICWNCGEKFNPNEIISFNLFYFILFYVVILWLDIVKVLSGLILAGIAQLVEQWTIM